LNNRNPQTPTKTIGIKILVSLGAIDLAADTTTKITNISREKAINLLYLFSLEFMIGSTNQV